MSMKPPLGSQLQLGHPLASGLVGYWLLNEGSGIIVNDLSGNNNNTGTFVSGAAWAAGKYGSAVAMDGGDWISTTTKERLEGKTTLTHVIWCCPTELNYNRLGGKRNTTEWYIRDDTRIRYTHNGAVNIDSSASITVGRWYCWAAVLNGTEVTLYQDGIQVGYGAVTGATAVNGYTFAIGNDAGSSASSYEFKGSISHYLLYDKACSVAEIRQLCRESFGMFQRSRIELWTGATSPTIVTPSTDSIMTLNTGFWGGV